MYLYMSVLTQPNAAKSVVAKGRNTADTALAHVIVSGMKMKIHLCTFDAVLLISVLICFG